MRYDFELVGKIGSMALIRREDADDGADDGTRTRTAMGH